MPVQEEYFYSMVSPSKEIQDSLDEIFGFHAVNLRLQVLDWILCQWNLDFGFHSLVGFPDFIELYSGFQSPGFRIPRAKISRTPGSLHVATMVRHKLKLAGEISFLSFYSGMLLTLC